MNEATARAGSRRRARVLGVVFAIIGAPLLLATVEAARYHARNHNNGSIVSSGQEREYLLYVPSGYDSTRQYHLLLACMVARHGLVFNAG